VRLDSPSPERDWADGGFDTISRIGDNADSATRTGTALVLVHGIGNDDPGTFLRRAIRSIDRVASDAGLESHSAATIVQPNGQTPAHSHLTIGDQTVLIAEASWADLLPRTSFRSVAQWLLVVAPFTVIVSVRDIPKRMSEIGRESRLRSLSWLVGAILTRVVLGAILFPVWFAPLLALIAVLTLLPGRAGRAAAGRVQAWVSSVLGDSYSFVDDPAVRWAVLGRVSDVIAWCDERADDVICLGHSQGSFIAMEAIRTDDSSSDRTLWTLGSGIRKLLGLRRIAAEAPWSTVRASAVVLALPVLVLLGWIAGGRWTALALGIAALALLLWWITVVAGDYALEVIRPEDQPNAKTWRDVWATRDIVPDGELPGVGPDESISVVNRSSPFSDHTTYLQNAEEVVIPLISELTPDNRARLGDDQELRQVRRRWWRQYRLLTAVGFIFLVADLAVRGFTSFPLVAATIIALIVWSRLELDWRLRRRRQLLSGNQLQAEGPFARWLDGSTNPHDFSLFAFAAIVGMAVSLLLGDGSVDWSATDPLTLDGWGDRYDWTALAASLGAVLIAPTMYLIGRTALRSRT